MQYLNEYSPYYDPFLAQRICINGQLMLLMLIEKFHLAGFKVVSANTDSVDVIYKEEFQDIFDSIISWWQDLTKIILEPERIKKTIHQDVNCYFQISESGYVKEKGRWITEPQLGKGYNMPVKNLALREYFIKGIPPEQTITNCKDKLLFCACQRVARKYEVVWQGEKQQRINRYYVSLRQDADYIFKKNGDSVHNLLKGHKVTILNNVNLIPDSELEIDYEYYINEVYKTINKIENEKTE